MSLLAALAAAEGATATVVVAIAVALITAFGGYLAAAKRLSGKIATSEADSLWKESASMREDYRAQISAALERQASLEARVAKLEERNAELLGENVELLRQAIDFQQTIHQLRDERDELKAKVSSLESRLQGRRSSD